jgi:hypothetical protein
MYSPVGTTGSDIVRFVRVIDNVQFLKSPEDLTFNGIGVRLYLKTMIIRSYIGNFQSDPHVV